MSYRFVKITSFYRDFLRQYYVAHPQVIEQSYENQYRHLMSQAYGWSDYFSLHLRALGVEAFEIVCNAKPLQQAWAKENGITGVGNDIVFAQLKKIKPDVIFFQDSLKFNSAFVKKVRKEIPSVKLTLGWCCTVYSDENIEEFRAFDCMMVCSEHYAAAFRARGLEVFQMHHAFETSLLSQIKESNTYPDRDFTFIGSLVPGSEFHMFRQQLIEYLVESNIDLDIYANITIISPIDLLLRRSAYCASLILKYLKLREIARDLPFIKKAYTLKEMPRNFKNISTILRVAKPPIYGIEMFKALAKSKISFNVHGDGAGVYAANVRLFEATGVGSCLLTDWKVNMHEIFEEDTEVVLYRNIEECKEKFHWLIDHPEKRAEIAKRGQLRVMKSHTYKHRVEQLNEIITHLLNK